MKHYTNLENFNRQLQSHDLSVLYFTASWCGPCKSMSFVMDDVADTFSQKMQFIKVDVNTASQLIEQYQIESVPSLVFLKGGHELRRSVGALPIEQVHPWIESCL